MADRTSIEWTNSSWTPIRARNLKTGKVGWHCEHATTGCEHCYAEGINRRLGTGLPFKPGHRKDIEIFVDEKMLLAPLKWRRPRRIFVGSMTDLFADFVTDEMLDKIFAVMALCPQHTFQVLTKRAERMRDYMTHGGPTLQTLAQVPQVGRGVMTANTDWPLPNVWAGVSCERQEEADERISLLLQTPAAVRFISAEPLLSAINLDHYLRAGSHRYVGSMMRGALQWVIVGGESGRNARPMSIQWARELRDQCAAAGVSFFFKQWGEWAPAGAQPSGSPGRFAFGDYEHDRSAMLQCDGYPRQFTKLGARSTLQRVGKKAAGSMLDGREHKDFPAAPAA